MRTDIHKPSSINPNDYTFVGFKYIGPREIERELALQYKEVIDKHMKKTQGEFSTHSHGGSCQVCGANSHYLGIFFHTKTNQYIQTGHECADKMCIGDSKAFKTFRKRIKNSSEFMTGKKKAQNTLAEANLSSCWEIYQTSYQERETKAEHIIADIVAKLVRYGSISQKQEEFLRKLLTDVQEEKERAARWEEENRLRQETAKDCPEGRVEIVGKVLTIKDQESDFGYVLKMLVEDETGFRVWGSVPSALLNLAIVKDGELAQRAIKREDKIKFSAKVSPSKDDKKFGFFSRPTKASLIEGK